MVSYSPYRRKLKPPAETRLLLVSSTSANASANQKLLEDVHGPGFPHLHKFWFAGAASTGIGAGPV